MIKPPLIAIFSSITIAMPLVPASAQDAQDAQSIMDKAADGRLKTIPRMKEALAGGDKAYQEKNYDLATKQYQTACDPLPEAPLTHDLRARALDGFSRASVKLAEQRITENHFEEAKGAAKRVLDPKYNPTYKPALLLLPIVDAEEIKKLQLLFATAQAFYDIGKYDLAYKSYDEVLKIDPYSVTITPLAYAISFLIVKEYKMPPGFPNGVRNTDVDIQVGPVSMNPEDKPAVPKRLSAREFLEGYGVKFPPGASADYIPSSSKLVVRNTEENLEMVDQIVSDYIATHSKNPATTSAAVPTR